MLVLTLKPGEGAYIGGIGRIRVLEVRGKQIKVGFDLAPAVHVSRDRFPLESHFELQRRAEVAGGGA